MFGGALPASPMPRRLSYHTDFSDAAVRHEPAPTFRNPITDRGPMEGRPPGEFFAHQRWDEFFPKVGYVMSLGQIAAGTRVSSRIFPARTPNSVWSYGTGTPFDAPSGTCRRR